MGGVQIAWSVGTYVEGVVNGSLTPVSGSFMMNANESTAALTFTVSHMITT